MSTTQVEIKLDETIKSEPKLKATPKAGFKMPKLKKGVEIVGFRPHGNTDILNKT
jgi:hypothetical protein